MIATAFPPFTQPGAPVGVYGSLVATTNAGSYASARSPFPLLGSHAAHRAGIRNYRERVMPLDQIQQVVSIAAAVGAGVGGVISWLVTWWWKVREQRDSVLVRYGSSRYDESPGFAMHVISRRNHRTEIVDYGFVLSTGRLLSMPVVWAQSFDDNSDDRTSGTTILTGLNDRYEIDVRVRDDGIVGAFARTSTQRRPRIDMARWSPLHVRLMVPLRVWWSS